MKYLSEMRLGGVPRGVGFVVCMLPSSADGDQLLFQLVAEMENHLGSVAVVAPALAGWRAPWQYRQEAGQDLQNIAVILEDTIALSDLIHIKGWTMQVEQVTQYGLRRRLNLNPGIVLADRVVAVSHKPRGNIRRWLGPRCWLQTVAIRSVDGTLRASRQTFSEYADPTRLALFERLAAKIGLSGGRMVQNWPQHNGAHNNSMQRTALRAAADAER